MKKKIIGLCAIIMLAAGCGEVPKLENGQDAIVKFKDGEMISVDDFFATLKEDLGLNTLITMVDTYIFEHEFDDYVDEAKESAQSYVDSFVEQFGSREKFLAQIQQETSYQTIEGYQNYLYLSFLQNHAIEEYAKDQISDKDVEKYYKDETIGDMEISHILIPSNASTSATSAEKKEAEEKAKKTAKEVIDKLNEAKKNKEDIAKKFSELAKEYSKDTATNSKGGSLGRINYRDLSSAYDDLIDAAKNLKDGEFSTKVITTELGYHVILKTKTYEKESLDKLKDEIVDVLADEYLKENQESVGITALQHYRKEYGMEIQDEEMKKQYSNYIQNALASINSNSNEE